jgi:protein involved in polysaccharide export with SLBB domain
VAGAVERPGVYQLLEGETLKELIGRYGSGFTPEADQSRLELVRRVNSISVSGDKIFLKESDTAGGFALENHDRVTVPEIIELEPVIFVEGAIGIEADASLTTSTRRAVTFNKGESYAALVRRNRGWFSSESDIKNAYIIRGDRQMAMNLTPMLYDADYRFDEPVVENDVLIIPFRQYFVTVAGAVKVPGRYPYIPDRDWEYYIALAGGFVAGQNAREAVVIKDLQGKKLNKTDTITPETVITASTNAFLYYFNQYAPVITTALTVITSFFTIMTYANR